MRLRAFAVVLIGFACGIGCSSTGSAPAGGDSGPFPDGSGTSTRDAAKDATNKKDAAKDAAIPCGEPGGQLCTDGTKCTKPSECKSGLCTAGLCTAPPPTCTDGIKNGMETDTDCGGDLCPACAPGKDCVKATDCTSFVCTGGKCQAPSPTDGVKNDSETDTDCGGDLLANGQPNPSSDMAPKCIPGKVCLLPSDCKQGVCNATPPVVGDAGAVDAAAPSDAASDAGDATSTTKSDGGVVTLYCQPASPTDGVTNDSETDTDCGGGFVVGGGDNGMSDGAPVCTLGQTCLLGTDCDQGVCNANANMGGGPVNCPGGVTCTCQAPAPNDGVQNDSETDVDCGGGMSLGSDGAPACAPLEKCLINTDCTSFVCGPTNICALPTPMDHVQNGGETDIDCGGTPPAPPTCVPNATEDCAPPCADDKTCLVDTDCLSAICSDATNKCVAAISCKGLVASAIIMDVTTPADTTPGGADAIGTPDPNGMGQHAGLDTCGTGESTDPPASQQHESCCKSLPITINGTALRYDKYEVTAGRMRQFLESLPTPYDVRDWALGEVMNNTVAGQTLLQQLPVNQAGVATDVLTLLPSTTDHSTPLNAVIQTGALVMDTSGSTGCFTDVGSFGAAMYWWDSPTLDDQAGSPPRPYTQDYYDIKAMNCLPYWMGVAFCAWDGGRLPLETEHDFVWQGGTGGTNTYPWGNKFLPNPYPGNGQLVYPNNADLTEAAYQPAVLHTVDWYDSNLGSATQPIGGFYYYPSQPLGTPLGQPDSIGTGLDYSPLSAAPGRFGLDQTSLKSTTGDGWQDLGANMIEMAAVTTYTGTESFCDESGPLDTSITPPEVYNCNCPAGGCTATSCAPDDVHCGITRATALPTYELQGGSWEGHAVQKDLTPFPIYRQYGKTGMRCMRPAEAP